MHRSGTSAFTRVTNLLGYTLPDELMPPIVDNNPTGFWESAAMADFNDQLLASAGSFWDDWSPLNPSWLSAPSTQARIPQAQALIERLFGAHPLIVLKDPRLCRLWPFWQSVFASLEVTVKLVLPLRNPLEVAESLRRRDGFSPRKGWILWLRYVLDAEFATRSTPRGWLHYDNLLSDWRQVMRQLESQLGLIWPRWSALTETEIDAFLSEGLRHHRLSEIESHPVLSDWVKRTVRALDELEKNQNITAAQDTLDQVRAEFDQAGAALGSIVLSEQQARHAAEQQLETLSNELTKRQATLESLTAQHEALTAQHQALISTYEQLDAQHQTLKNLQQRLFHYTQQQRTRIQQLAATQDLLGRWHEHLLWPLCRQWLCLEQRLPRLTQGSILFLATAMNLLRLRPLSAIRHARARRALLASGLFDATWYRQRYPEVAEQALSAADHWLGHGRQLGYWPHPLFDSSWYLSQVPPESVPVLDPIQHYLKQGAAAGLNPHPLFDTRWYLSQNPELAASEINPLRHFIQQGGQAGRAPHPLFDSAWYLAQNPDVAAAGVNPLLHYLEHGAAEGRQPHPDFDGFEYEISQPQIICQGINPLVDQIKRRLSA